MKIIGLCGQSGAGKTTALEVFERSGFAVIDCDAVSRLVTSPDSPCVRELAERFGEGILNADKSLKRQALADIVFLDAESLADLNRITHKHILKEVFCRLDKFRHEGYRAAVVDAPVLFESGLDRDCDTTLAVCADLETRLERITSRDGISRERAEARVSRQLSDMELSRLADRVIYNNSDLESFRNEVLKYVKEIGDDLE